MVKDLLAQCAELKKRVEDLTLEKEELENIIDDLEFKIMVESIQVGDEIKVTDKYESYTSYVDFMDYLRDTELIGAHDAYRFAYAETPDDKHTFEVLASAKHLATEKTKLLYVRDYINLKCYIVNADVCVKVEDND